MAGASHALGTIRRVVRAAIGGYASHRATQNAAAIAFRVLFSLVPLVAFLVALIDLLIPAEWRAAVTDWVVESLSGSSGLEESVRRSLEGRGATASVAGAVALAGLLWTASAMIGSIRLAFAEIWEQHVRRAYIRGKVLDVALVFAAGLFALGSFAVAVLAQGVGELAPGSDAPAASWALRALGQLIGIGGTLALTACALLGIYRILPPVRPDWRALWPGALVGATGYQLATVAYGAYLARFDRLSIVYGSLGALLGFLLVVYAGAAAMLFGAEIVVALGRDAERDTERNKEERGGGAAT